MSNCTFRSCCNNCITAALPARLSSVVALSVVALSVVALSVVALSVVVLSVVVLSVVALSVVALSVVALSVVGLSSCCGIIVNEFLMILFNHCNNLTS